MASIRDIIKDRERCITENIDEKYQSDVLGRLKGCADTVVDVYKRQLRNLYPEKRFSVIFIKWN